MKRKQEHDREKQKKDLLPRQRKEHLRPSHASEVVWTVLGAGLFVAEHMWRTERSRKLLYAAFSLPSDIGVVRRAE